MSTILITGAAGRLGGMLRSRLAAKGRTLRLLDIAPLAAGPAEEVVQASITDLAAVTAGDATAVAPMIAADSVTNEQLSEKSGPGASIERGV